MKKTKKICYFFKALILLISQQAFAQNGSDTLVTDGLRLGWDIGGTVMGFAKVSNQKFEFSADWSKKNRFYVAEIGFARKNQQQESYDYAHNGFYTKLGIEKNTRKGDDALFVGFRYAFSMQTYQTKNITIKDPYWGVVTAENIATRNLQLHWLEGVGGIKVKFWQNFYMGYTVRVKFKAYFSSFGDYQPLTILGYGKPDKSVQLGMSYYIFYKIPFTKK
jgi:hypothetical protein